MVMDCLQLLLYYPSRIEEPLDEGESWLEMYIKKLRSWHLAGPITSWQIKREKMETVTDFIFLGSRITVDSD